MPTCARPRIDQFFGLDPTSPGLSSFLSLQVARPERVVHANVLPSLSVMTAGPPVARPQELLSGNRFRDGTNTLLREYDLVLFDTPASNSNADALTVGAAAGYALMVARRNLSYFKDVDRPDRPVGGCALPGHRRGSQRVLTMATAAPAVRIDWPALIAAALAVAARRRGHARSRRSYPWRAAPGRLNPACMARSSLRPACG